MAIYTTAVEAAERLSQYTGFNVPSTVGSPSPMDKLITEASRLMEEYIGYPWEDVSYSEDVDLDRTGMGQLMYASPVGKLVKSLDTVAIPASAQYQGPLTLSPSQVEWNSFGMLSLSHLPLQASDGWQNPLSLSQYPSRLTVQYTAGPRGTVPGIFEDVCIKIVAVLVLQSEDTDMLVSSKIDLKDMGLETENTFIQDPIARALRPLSRYKS